MPEQELQAIDLDHVQVAAPAGCEDAARQFYGELLGLTEIAKPVALQSRGGVWFTVGPQQLHIGVADPFTPAHKAHPAFRYTADGLQSLAARLEASGIEVTWADPSEIPGRPRFHCLDPWGNRVELLSDEPNQAAG